MQRQRCACALVSLALSLGGGASVAAQGAVRVTPERVQVEIPIGRSTHESWRWNEAATPDGRAEYVWSARLGGDSTHVIGFMLFKLPGATPQEGTFAELLRAGDSVLVVELRDRALIATMFARRPHEVTFHMLSPYSEVTTRKVRVSYDGF